MVYTLFKFAQGNVEGIGEKYISTIRLFLKIHLLLGLIFAWVEKVVL